MDDHELQTQRIARLVSSGANIRRDGEACRRLRHRLAVIDAASHVTDINMPGYKLHALTGDRDGVWSISVSGNWRITFEFVNGDAYILDYEDYH